MEDVIDNDDFIFDVSDHRPILVVRQTTDRSVTTVDTTAGDCWRSRQAAGEGTNEALPAGSDPDMAHQTSCHAVCTDTGDHVQRNI